MQAYRPPNPEEKVGEGLRTRQELRENMLNSYWASVHKKANSNQVFGVIVNVEVRQGRIWDENWLIITGLFSDKQDAAVEC